MPACGSDDAEAGPAPQSDPPRCEQWPECSDAAASPPGIPEGPAGDAFYQPPDPLPAGGPGDLIWATPIEGPPGTTAWRILYRSTTVKDTPIAVSGMLFAPDPLPGTADAPILTYSHGATGLGDACAPSRTFGDAGQEGYDLFADLTQHYVVVATDYEGLGTPGVHPWIVGLSEARGALDAVRVAQRFPGLGTSTSSPSVSWGHSQGGGASLVTGELAATYAPDANLKGVAAGAPAAELKLLAGVLSTSPYFGYLFMAAAGFDAAYPELESTGVFTEAGVEAATAAGEGCAGDTIEALRGKDPSAYVKADPGTTEPYASLLEENSPGFRPGSVPVFLYHGEADEQIPPIASQLVLDRYCKNGTTATRKTYPGADHGGAFDVARPDVIQYLDDRLAGKPAPTSC
jgi:hypothetical protein